MFNHKDLALPNIRNMHMVLLPKGGATVPSPQSWPDLRGTVLIFDESTPGECVAGDFTRWAILNPYLPPGPLRWLSFTDPPSGARPMLPHPAGTGNLACTGQTILDDGRVFIAAGNDLHGHNQPQDYASPPPPCIRGQYHAYLFDPTQGTISSDQNPLLIPRTWFRQEPGLFRRRWYPAVVLITVWNSATSRVETRVVVLGGNHEPVTASTYEVWVPPSGGAQQGSWQQNQQTSEFQFQGPAGQYLGYYAYSQLMSNGQLVVSPFFGGTWTGNTFNAVPPQPSTLRHGSAPEVWTTFSNDPARVRYRTWGCSLLMPNLDPNHANSLVLFGGGYDAAGPSTVDLQMCKPQHTGLPVAGCWPSGYWWTDLSPTVCNNALTPLSVPRYGANTVILPYGSFLVIGGGGGVAGTLNTNSIVRWYGGKWHECASLIERFPGVPGGYGFHSTALLLPDGSVLVGAGDPFPNDPVIGGIRHDYQIYSPWYLIEDVVRPTILSVNAGIEGIPYGHSFTITHVVEPGLAINKVVLLRPSSVTHGCNSEQRYIELEIIPPVDGAPPGQITAMMPAKAPSDPTITSTEVSGPPGYYMLFLVSSASVPSVAAWVRLMP